ncbi:hypothetical protein [Streptomyces similanensis]|uniref:Uncharacterized protein n=1 Tax=Streptomyces similanensis TaxID=1274988 RepID=A0ABP9KH92_9ACTN
MAASGSAGSDTHKLNLDFVPEPVRNAFRLYYSKDEAANLVMKVTTINNTLDYLKIGLAAVSTGLTVVKADFTFLKIDEKGITWLGNTVKPFPWAKEGDKWWRRVVSQKKIDEFEDKEKEKEKLKKEQEELKKLRPYVDKTFYRQSRAAGLNQRINHAQNTADQAKTKAQSAENKVNELRRSLRTAGENAKQTERVRNQNFTTTRDSVNKLSQALAGI